MTEYRIKNWEKYQAVKDRRPPWIKLHRSILDDLDYAALTPANRCLLMELWVLATEHDGKVTGDTKVLSFRLRRKVSNLDPLISRGFLIPVNACLQPLTDVCLEGEGEGDLKPSCANLFARFWSAYPKKKSKGDAEKAFKAIKPDEQLVATMIATIERAKKSEDWLKEGGKYIPYPATWLRAKGWEDELEMAAIDSMSQIREAYPDAG